jgi:hypothetical protein
MVIVLTLRAPELCQTGGGFDSDAGPNGSDGEARSCPFHGGVCPYWEGAEGSE